jgi:hypothetical protein
VTKHIWLLKPLSLRVSGLPNTNGISISVRVMFASGISVLFFARVFGSSLSRHNPALSAFDLDQGAADAALALTWA